MSSGRRVLIGLACAGQKNLTRVIRLLARNSIDEAILGEQAKTLGDDTADLVDQELRQISLLKAHPVLGHENSTATAQAADEAGPSNA